MNRWMRLLGAVAVAGWCAASPAHADTAPAEGDSAYTIKGGQDRTDLKSLTVEGEDRVHVEIERPALVMDLDPSKVAGLVTGDARDVLDRVPPDLTTSYYASTSQERSPYTGRPWLRQFSSGSVARFQPAVKGVESWKLTVADSRGQAVAQFSGKGDPPKEIVWDGRGTNGAPVTPGVTYSYVFEAKDKAGNKRNFVGEGFSVSAYRLDGAEGPMLVFNGRELATGPAGLYGGAGAVRPTAPILLETASWLNQSPNVMRPVRVTATGRSMEQATSLAKQVTVALAANTLGDPARIQAVPEVVTDAPDGGTVRVTLGASAAYGTTPALRGASGDVKDDATSKEPKKGSKKDSKKESKKN
ncbi:MAG TPA: hypothetical protein VFU59_06750 [Candidatus Eisenbacteria bacterium]|nr:hypothetical protein [Candidatus Eisenbacteria bacterium]